MNIKLDALAVKERLLKCVDKINGIFWKFFSERHRGKIGDMKEKIKLFFEKVLGIKIPNSQNVEKNKNK